MHSLSLMLIVVQAIYANNVITDIKNYLTDELYLNISNHFLKYT